MGLANGWLQFEGPFNHVWRPLHTRQIEASICIVCRARQSDSEQGCQDICDLGELKGKIPWDYSEQHWPDLLTGSSWWEHEESGQYVLVQKPRLLSPATFLQRCPIVDYKDFFQKKDLADNEEMPEDLLNLSLDLNQ